MEVDLKNFQVDHSQGSHFFHNITSAGIPYFYIRYQADESFLDWDWLESLDSIREAEYFRHVRPEDPLLIVANGKKRRGVITKPDAAGAAGSSLD
jgi:hypothetical protein